MATRIIRPGHLGLNFPERLIPLDTPEFARDLGVVSPTRRVPVLQHGRLVIWDSLAICEYACELAGRGWPREREARAVCAEMQAGFSVLRSQWPMNARAEGRRTPADPHMRDWLAAARAATWIIEASEIGRGN